MGNLSNLYISQSFQSLIHLGSDSTATSNLTLLQDGFGNSIGVGVNTAGDLFLSGSLTASLQEGYVYVGDASGKTSAFATASLVTNINTGSLVGTASFNAYTQSTNVRLTNIESTTASLNSSVTQLNANTASQQVSINALNTFTSSANIRLNNLESTSASVNISIQNLNSKTGSYATTGSNTFYGNQIISGSGTYGIDVSNGIKADYFYTDTQGVFTPTLYGATAGLGKLQIEALDGVNINGAVTASAAKIANLNYPTADNGAKSFIQTDGAGNLSLQYVQTVYETIRNMSGVTLQKGTPVYISGSTGDNGNAYIADASNVDKMPAVYIAGETLGVGATGLALLGGKIDGVDTSLYPAGTIIYVAEGGGWTDQRPSGSNSVVQVLGVVQKQGVGGQGVVINQLEAVLPNIQTGYTWVGNGLNQPVQVATSSFIASGSGPTDITALNQFTASQELLNSTFATTSSLNSYTASNDQRVTSLEANTASVNTSITNLNTSASLALVTASFDNGTRNLTFTKGDTTQFSVTIPDVSGSAGDFVTTSSFNAYTQSTDDRLTNIESTTASLNTSVSNLDTFSASALVSIDNLNTATASLFTSASLGLTTASVTLNTITFTKGDGTTFPITVDTGSVATIDTGSFATTGSNFFIGVEAINSVEGTGAGEVYLLGRSGSLILGNSTSTPTYAALSHLSSSQINANTNLIFKDNSNTGDTIISGSGNIFTNPTAPATGRTNYIGGNTNLFLNGQADQLPTITGSAASVSGNRPTMNGNIITGTPAWTINQAANPGAHNYFNNIINGVGTQWNFNMTGNTGTVQVNNNLGLGSTMTLNSPSRSIAQINAGESGSNGLSVTNNSIQGTFNYNGPVSSSTHTLNQNTIAGTVQLNAQSGSRGFLVQGNIINGTLIYTDNTVFAPTLGSTNNLTNNNINGSAAVNQRSSSSILLANNNINSWTISNDYDASSIATPVNRTVNIGTNILFGQTANNLYLSGSAAGATNQKVILGNLFGGGFISASSVADGTDSSLISTIGVGSGLNILGTTRRDASTSIGGDHGKAGSAFFGRWNKEGAGFNTTSEVILAVGTGTSGSAGIVRKTGFLIDSGSNMFVEGTLNVSGATSLNGDLNITGSLTASLQQGFVYVGDASGITTTVSTSSFGGGGAAFPYTGSAQITGSLGITGSLSGFVNDLAIVSNTASMNFNDGNFFTLQLVSGSITHLTATNVIPGQTINLLVKMGTSPTAASTGSLTFSPTFKFAGGFDYTPTTITGSQDLVSFVTFDTTQIFAAQVKNLL